MNLVSSRREHPRRTFRWEGLVEEVDEDSFWARLIPTDHKGPEIGAEFNLSRLPEAEPGVLFNLYMHRRGKKRRYVLRKRDLGVWTAEELASIKAKAHELAEKLRASGWPC
mgnify:FL=1